MPQPTPLPPGARPDGSVAISTFDGADPNGTWRLWVMDNVPGVAGEIRGGWELRITAEVDTCTVEEQIPTGVDELPAAGNDAKKHKKGSKRHKGNRRR